MNSVQHVNSVLKVAGAPVPLAKAQLDPPDNTRLIQRSWFRCVNEHGLDPARNARSHVETASVLRERRGQIEEYLQVARAGMEQMYKRVSQLGYVLMLADAEGVTVDYIGNNSWDAQLKEAGLHLGANWNEAYAGTGGIGACVAEQVPVACHRSDHFYYANINLSCNTVPLFDPEGGFMGVLDVSLLTPSANHDSLHLVRQLTSLYGQMIEDSNFMRHFRHRWILRLSATSSLVDVCGELVLAFDRDGVIVGAGSSARRQLRCRQAGPVAPPLVGSVLTDIFRCSMDEISTLSRGVSPLDRVLLGTLDGQLFHASVTGPQVAARTATAQVRTDAEAGSREPPCQALDRLAGGDRNMARILDMAKRLVNKQVNILLQGETGTGKDVFAKALHESSRRAKRPFIAVNCAALPESLIESELFGYSSGAFTGARSKGMKGLIAQADGGTLFLDEIGDMPLGLQTRLLRVLAEKEVLPLGAEKPIVLELTVIAASHRDLRQQIAAGTFREDLYYRLCGATLAVPPLRERTDREFIIQRILEEEADNLGTAAAIDCAALALLMRYRWPGNIRQLRNVLRYALALSDGHCIGVDNLPSEVSDGPVAGTAFTLDAAAATSSLHPGNGTAYSLAASGDGMSNGPLNGPLNGSPNGAPDSEAARLLALLQRHRWNITAVANELDVYRTTIYRQMKRFGINDPRA
jgi:transcriptional regulator of acetoin/glycerol metabolism